MRKFGALFTLLMVVGSACTKTATSTNQGQQSFNVQLDGKTESFNGGFTAFFPSQLAVHAGDDVTFKIPHFTGEPHTVTLGTLVDAGLAKLKALGPKAESLAAQENSQEFLNLPDVFNHKNPPGGPPDANQSAAQPCFLATGIPPLSLTGSAPACAKVAQPEFDGTQAFYNSGVLFEDNATFKVKLSKTIKPGTYGLICLVHRGGMTASLTVEAPAKSVLTPDAATSAGQKQFNDIVTKLTPVAKQLEAATADKAFAGGGDPTVINALVAEFGPKSVSIPVGGTVSWSVLAFHSLTFNAKESDVGALFSKAADGSIHFTPNGAPSEDLFKVLPPAVFEFPPADDAKPITIDLGTWDGSTALRSTGILGSVPPQFVTVKQTFEKAGTYTLRCMVHPDMKAEIKVG